MAKLGGIAATAIMDGGSCSGRNVHLVIFLALLWISSLDGVSAFLGAADMASRDLLLELLFL
jgi:hypothetical protein